LAVAGLIDCRFGFCVVGHDYLDEFSFRLNRKELEMTEVFSDVVGGIANSGQLPYKVLTA
jgi:hypothetical protein